MKPQHRLIDLPERVDPRGSLFFAQDDSIPFAVKRLFALYDLTPGISRGGHAHRAQHQLLMMPAGGVTVVVDDGRKRTAVRLDRPNRLLHVPPLLWLDLEDFTPGAVCMVLASDVYLEADYIRDRDEFLRIAGN